MHVVILCDFMGIKSGGVACLQARKYVLDDLNKTGKAARVKGFERIAAVWLDAEEWSVDNDMVCSSVLCMLNSTSVCFLLRAVLCLIMCMLKRLLAHASIGPAMLPA